MTDQHTEREVLSYRWRDGRGTWCEAEGLLYLPAAAAKGTRHPLLFHAGYEVPEAGVVGFNAAGVAVLTTRTPEEGTAWPGGNPVSRGPEMDLALLRVARAHPSIDDGCVVVHGGSAGGYMALMVAAGTFPLNGAFPGTPVVDVSYTLACWFHDRAAVTALRPDGRPTMLHAARPDGEALARSIQELHGPPGSVSMRAWSPIVHLERITCPVAMYVTTADVLVPFGQIGGPLAPRIYSEAPAAYPVDPAVVARGIDVGPPLLDALAEHELQVEVLAVPEGAHVLADTDDPPPSVSIPAPEQLRRWLVMVIDEGPPSEDVAHFKHAVGVDVIPLIHARLTAPPPLDQLTPAKLAQLGDRAAGRGWIQPGHHAHASDPEVLEAERADVRRGIRTYCGASPAHGEHFETLVAALDDTRRAELAPLR